MEEVSTKIHELVRSDRFRKISPRVIQWRASRNSSRRKRRKKSKLKYYSSLKRTRNNRKGDDLCAAISLVNIASGGTMEWTPVKSSSALATDVAEWHRHDQIAYWRSRALSLEQENRMLLQHIRNVYAKQTEDYANYTKQQQEIEYQESSTTLEEKKSSSNNSLNGSDSYKNSV